MNREEAEDFIYSSYVKAEKNQDYHAKDSRKRHPELTREILRKKAGTPAVNITGSKGKGSVANMISQILQSEYDKVGLMTSPHLNRFNERFKINGKDISDADFVQYMEMIRPEIEEIEKEIPEDICISPMGIQADLALTYFNAEQTGFNIFEGGKGAQYDDVNNVVHDYAVIQPVFLEHTRELGDTIEAIAADKAHIITGSQKCIFLAEQEESVLQVIKKRADENAVLIRIYGRDFYADKICYGQDGMHFDVVIGEERYKDLCVPLLGEHQAKNCALAMALCREVLGRLDLKAVREKLQKINWPGRMDVLSSEPFVMLDACINQGSTGNVKNIIREMKLKDVTVIIGIPDDKDYAGVVRSMSEIAGNIILTKSQNLHYVFTSAQKDRMEEEGIHTTWTGSIEEAIRLAHSIGKPMVILGTTSVVSEVSRYFRE